MAFSAALRRTASAATPAAIRALRSSAPAFRSSAPLLVPALRSSAPLLLLRSPLPPRFSSSSHYYSTSTWMSAPLNWLLKKMLTKMMILGDDGWIVLCHMTIEGEETTASLRVANVDDQGGIEKKDEEMYDFKLVSKRGDSSVECNLLITNPPPRVEFVDISVKEGTNEEDVEYFKSFSVRKEKTLRELCQKISARGTSSEDIEYFEKKKKRPKLEEFFEYLEKNKIPHEITIDYLSARRENSSMGIWRRFWSVLLEKNKVSHEKNN